MDGFDKRAYQRTDHVDTRVRVSRDSECWVDVEAVDISSGGLAFKTDEDFDEGQMIWLDLELSGFLSEYELVTEGKVLHKAALGGRFQYGLSMPKLQEHEKIRLDEMVKGDRPVLGQSRHAD